MSQLFIGENLIHLRNDRVSYLIHILPGGVPMQLYWGKRLEAMEPARSPLARMAFSIAAFSASPLRSA